MKMLRPIQVGLVVLTALGVALSVSACDDDEGTVKGSGTVEATTVSLRSDTGGTVLETYVSEGDDVGEGEPLLRLDDILVQAALDQAAAARAMAEIKMEKLTAGARPEEIAAAEAQLAQAMAQWDGARKAWERANDVLQDPVELQDQLDAAETMLAQAEVEVSKAQGQLDLAEQALAAATTAGVRLGRVPRLASRRAHRGSHRRRRRAQRGAAGGCRLARPRCGEAGETEARTTSNRLEPPMGARQGTRDVRGGDQGAELQRRSVRAHRPGRVLQRQAAGPR
jgi:multidrug resistance efflux pump